MGLFKTPHTPKQWLYEEDMAGREHRSKSALWNPAKLISMSKLVFQSDFFPCVFLGGQDFKEEAKQGKVTPVLLAGPSISISD